MKVIIIANGEINKIKNIKQYNFIVAADGGANYCYQNKIKPNLIIGDFDSIDNKVKKYYSKMKSIVHIIDVDQNTTDIEKALNYIKNNFKNKLKSNSRIDILGATSNIRLDHTLYNVNLLKQYSTLPIKINSLNYSVEIISKNKIIRNRKNKTISLFSVSKIKKINLTGFKWLLPNNCNQNNISVSNVIIRNIAKINFSQGKIILIINK
ncbi:MAG: thiamine diphosphokinase [Patescibacteria group bacterium]